MAKPPVDKKDVLGEKVIDEIVDEIFKEVYGKKDVSKPGDAMDRMNLREVIKLKNRVTAIENRLEKLVKGFRTESVESERHITASSEETKSEAEQTWELIAGLQGRLDDLRTIVVMLSNEMKSLKSGK